MYELDEENNHIVNKETKQILLKYVKRNRPSYDFPCPLCKKYTTVCLLVRPTTHNNHKTLRMWFTEELGVSIIDYGAFCFKCFKDLLSNPEEFKFKQQLGLL